MKILNLCIQVATEKASLDEKKGETLEDMSRMVHQLTLKISERKARLAPIIKVISIQILKSFKKGQTNPNCLIRYFY